MSRAPGNCNGLRRNCRRATRPGPLGRRVVARSGTDKTLIGIRAAEGGSTEWPMPEADEAAESSPSGFVGYALHPLQDLGQQAVIVRQRDAEVGVEVDALVDTAREEPPAQVLVECPHVPA